MKFVFVLQHSYQFPATGEEETKFIGVYSTRAKAEEAIGRLSFLPGFKDLADGFCIDEYEIDRDHWAEGFVTEIDETEYSVWRQDDNGNVFLIADKLTEIEAFRLVREYEQKGHKQTYWVQKNL